MEMAVKFNRSGFTGCAGFLECVNMSERRNTYDRCFQKGRNIYGEVLVEVDV